ncbi:MAG: T9SS type A sorting domain-containing protein [Flavobacteriales bacterium]|nr:T9SS type A sorting domain-containing protein [Flavobacteriales bacterium]MCC6936888.1 T9SS type A sorting domain-containing protein [Flavobacteriales bacterium]
MPSLAQNWGLLGSGLPPDPHTIYADTVSDKLLVGGRFRRVHNGNDSVDVMGVAAWDGQRWDSLANRLQTVDGDWQEWVSPIDRFRRYQGQLYASGSFGMMLTDTTFLHNNARLNEATMNWEPLECDFLGGIWQMTSEVDDTLYYTGYMTQFCDTFPETCFVQYDGEHFHPFQPFYDLPYYSNNLGNIVVSFQGQFYMAGLFTVDTIDVEYYGIMRYTGSQWEPVPGFEAAAPIKQILVHDNKLYVSGYFRKYQGAPGNSIAVFDGTTWDDLGGGMLMDLDDPSYLYPQVRDFLFHDGDLIAVGNFNFAGDTPARNIAKWTGDRWCSYGGFFEQSIVSAAIWRDTLYVAGNFSTIDGVPYGYVARWDGGDYTESCSTPVGLPEVAYERDLKVFPNPTADRVWVELPPDVQAAGRIRILDPLGRELYSFAMLGRSDSFDVHDLHSGSYFIQHISGSGVVRSARFLKL